MSQTERWDTLQALAHQVVSTDQADAWQAFWIKLQPELELWVNSPRFLGRLHRNPEWCRDVVLLMWEKLQQNDCSKLRAYFASQSSGKRPRPKHPFASWLYRVLKNTGIDYMRSLPEYIRHPRKRAQEASNSGSLESDDYWRPLVTLHSKAEMQTHSISSEVTARQLLDYLDTSITPRQREIAALYRAGADIAAIARIAGIKNPRTAKTLAEQCYERMYYRQVLELWSQNYTHARIAEVLGLNGSDATARILRAAKALLKRQFRL